MSEDKKVENTQGDAAQDPKAKMLAALAKKQKGQNSGKSLGPTGGSKVGAGQTGGAAPKMHIIKAVSA
jgi:hypothetical protein